ncbi:hypothetical protein EN813_038340 [Mesorhizobium sp. M00.F.Ca.ET.170.01.1.1]|nr:hypothetical protein EN813_038340 [Mesorhizobium sp. M00.F.Ca.ET.170.01.1.1]
MLTAESAGSGYATGQPVVASYLDGGKKNVVANTTTNAIIASCTNDHCNTEIVTADPVPVAPAAVTHQSWITREPSIPRSPRDRNARFLSTNPREFG